MAFNNQLNQQQYGGIGQANNAQVSLSRTAQPPQSLITYNHITYALAMFSYFTAGLTWIVPIIMNYLKRDEARGTWLESHFNWQIKTFWYSILFGVFAVALIAMGFGSAIFGLAANNHVLTGNSSLVGLAGLLLGLGVLLWHLYRMIRGWIALTKHQPLP